MNIYLVRHGQTTGDIENRYGGDYDDHLTDLGKQQSEGVARKLADKNIGIIYCSPKIRAKETAEIVRRTINIPLTTIDNFRERNRYGILTGLTKEEAKQKFPDQVLLLADEHSTVAEGEDYNSFGIRIREALQKIDTGKYSTAAVVTHGGPIRYIFREILKEGEIEIGDCAYANISVANDSYILHEVDGVKLNT
ncbi:MAG TPA: histidine phosphatase family protein [Candidatus Saccharimonadales bacterium]|nr:histidine phosphatase family protein [Candidatus Saccharimonadales bacterium]HSX27486.1 histidine phosphatase family protein [Patescibacteria group bacterium]